MYAGTSPARSEDSRKPRLRGAAILRYTCSRAFQRLNVSFAANDWNGHRRNPFCCAGVPPLSPRGDSSRLYFFRAVKTCPLPPGRWAEWSWTSPALGAVRGAGRAVENKQTPATRRRCRAPRRCSTPGGHTVRGVPWARLASQSERPSLQSQRPSEGDASETARRVGGARTDDGDQGATAAQTDAKGGRMRWSGPGLKQMRGLCSKAQKTGPTALAKPWDSYRGNASRITRTGKPRT